MGFPIVKAVWGVVAKSMVRGMFPGSNCKGYMSTPQALGDRLVRPPHKPLEKMGDPTFLSTWLCAPSLAYFH